MIKRSLAFISVVIFLYGNAIGQKPNIKKQENVIYGMISGTALLMDVYQPENPNHRGIVFIAGSGFGFGSDYQKTYNQVPLKNDYFLDPKYGGKWPRELVERGLSQCLTVSDNRRINQYL